VSLCLVTIVLSTFATFCKVLIAACEGSLAKKPVANIFRKRKVNGDLEEEQAGSAFPEMWMPVGGSSAGRSNTGLHWSRLVASFESADDSALALA